MADRVRMSHVALCRQVGRLRSTGATLGTVFLYMFAGTAGMNSGSLAIALQFTPAYVFLAILYSVHLLVMLLAQRVWNLDLAEVLVASNACIGAPPTAAAFAASRGVFTIQVEECPFGHTAPGHSSLSDNKGGGRAFAASRGVFTILVEECPYCHTAPGHSPESDSKGGVTIRAPLREA
eukprot:3280678-Pyramimonas_sp.AAC.1